jgi:hypothetical protein
MTPPTCLLCHLVPPLYIIDVSRARANALLRQSRHKPAQAGTSPCSPPLWAS